MSPGRWRLAKAAAVALAVAAATLGALAGLMWAPAAMAPVVLVAALLRDPPQGRREWLLVGWLTAIAGLVAVIVAASLNAP